MINTARLVGASAKFAGSGGAIVGTVSSPEMLNQLTKTMATTCRDWQVISPQIPPPR